MNHFGNNLGQKGLTKGHFNPLILAPGCISDFKTNSDLNIPCQSILSEIRRFVSKGPVILVM